MTYIPLFRSYDRAMKIAKERPYQNFRVYYLVRQDFSAGRLYEDTLDLLVDHNLKTGQDVINYKKEAIVRVLPSPKTMNFVSRVTNSRALIVRNSIFRAFFSTVS